jgi:TolA-binding protein
MGEFYYNEGDMENALKYYNKAIEMYPPASSANSMILRIGELSKS